MGACWKKFWVLLSPTIAALGREVHSGVRICQHQMPLLFGSGSEHSSEALELSFILPCVLMMGIEAVSLIRSCRIARFGRDLQGSPSPTPDSTQDHPQIRQYVCTGMVLDTGKMPLEALNPSL